MVTQICTMASRMGGGGGGGVGMAYRIGRQWWCKKEGNTGLIIRENGIVLYLAHFYM